MYDIYHASNSGLIVEQVHVKCILSQLAGTFCFTINNTIAEVVHLYLPLSLLTTNVTTNALIPMRQAYYAFLEVATPGRRG